MPIPLNTDNDTSCVCNFMNFILLKRLEFIQTLKGRLRRLRFLLVISIPSRLLFTFIEVRTNVLN